MERNLMEFNGRERNAVEKYEYEELKGIGKGSKRRGMESRENKFKGQDWKGQSRTGMECKRQDRKRKESK